MVVSQVLASALRSGEARKKRRRSARSVKKVGQDDSEKAVVQFTEVNQVLHWKDRFKTILCEECGSEAVCRCEACEETLCPKCFALIHIPRSNGNQHTHLVQRFVRSLTSNDVTGRLQQCAPNPFFPKGADLEVTEDDLLMAGIDLSIPKAIEAPSLNLCRGDSRKIISKQFETGELVLIPQRPDEERDDDISSRYWLGVLESEKRQMVMASGQNLYRVRRLRKATRDFLEEVALAANIDERRHKKKRELFYEHSGLYTAALQGFLEPPTIFKATMTLEELQRILESNDSSTELVPENHVKRPKELRLALETKRAHASSRVLHSLDARTSLQRLKKALQLWTMKTSDMIQHERNISASLIARSWKRKKHRDFHAALDMTSRAAENALRHSKASSQNKKFRYCLTAAEKAKGYTIDQRVYFHTRKELEQWAAAMNRAGQTVCDKFLKRAKILLSRAFIKFKDHSVQMLKIEQEVESHYRDNSYHENEQCTPEDTLWHPAIGADLPPLPNLWSTKVAGNHDRDISDRSRYLAMRVSMRGPTCTSTWLIPGRVLFGAHPSGPAELDAYANNDDATIALIASSRVTVFAAFGDEEEDFNYEQSELGWTNGMHGIIKDALNKVRMRLSAKLARCESQLSLATASVDKCPQYPRDDSRYEESERIHFLALAKERRALQARDATTYQLRNLPSELQLLRMPTVEEDQEDEKLMDFIFSIEECIRSKKVVYLYSRLGHGRVGVIAAVLLGRLYGLTAIDALDRVQVYHDARLSVIKSGRVISCPQTVKQISTVQRLLATFSDTIYSESVRFHGHWADHCTYTKPQRGLGVPTAARATREPLEPGSPLVKPIVSPTTMKRESLSSFSRQQIRASYCETPDKKTSYPPVFALPTMRSLRPAQSCEEIALPPVASRLLPATSSTAKKMTINHQRRKISSLV